MDCLTNTARAFSVAAHAAIKQTRADNTTPYYAHTARVAALVKEAADPGNADTLVAAAHLHDTLEDTGVTVEDLLQVFPANVVALVVELTDRYTYDVDQRPRAERKRDECERLAATSPEAQTVKLCDIAANLEELQIVADRRFSEKFERTLMREYEALIAALSKGTPKAKSIAMHSLNHAKVRAEHRQRS